MKFAIVRWFQSQWQTVSLWHIFLIPISYIFLGLVRLRRIAYQRGWLNSTSVNVPVIIVGNITVGGSGKTPLVIYLAQLLASKGYTPGIISRGYRGQAQGALAVSFDSDVTIVGDEPLLLATKTSCPVFVGKNRVQAAQALLKVHPECDVIISDDGLQHYALKRNYEIVVVDADKQLGNALMLPAGPLREPKSRLLSVDAIIYNGFAPNAQNFSMQLLADGFCQVLSPSNIVGLDYFSGKKVHAIAGIGNPNRFFKQLKKQGLMFEAHSFIDHHDYIAEDFVSFGDDVVLMTEKDAVKCKQFAKQNWYFMAVTAQVDARFTDDVLHALSNQP